MAKFISKHFGIGGKKAPPHPPNKDYGAQKSSSVQELLTKSPTRDRSTLSLATGPCHEYDAASLTDQSPHHRSHHSLAERVGFGTRPKESRNLSPKSATVGRCTAVGNCALEEDPGTEGEDPSKTRPKLLDEYSDPFDLKKQIADNPELLGACAQTQGVADDDYSVPYEVKKLIKENKMAGLGAAAEDPGAVGGDPSTAPGKVIYEDPYEEGTATSQCVSAMHDRRPREDYDEPWEWSARQSAMFQAHMDDTNESQAQVAPNRTPLMTPKRTNAAEAASENAKPNGVMEQSLQNGGEMPAEVLPSTSAQPSTSAHGGQQKRDTRVGNYEEPWDLSSTQKDLEDKIKAASISGAMESEKTGSKELGASGGGGACAAPHVTDKRSLEGYEKPWDWKPHRKDDRGQEGYEKPWDWKPHQKDDRPTEEYEEPWDNKAIEELGLPDTHEVEGSAAGGSKASDERPSEEYEEPWDQKKNKNFLARAGAEGGQSPLRKHKLDLPQVWSNNLVGERVDAVLPLDQQGWYHGSIGRVDAEALLRVHKEGSYLVRMSESNKQDFSLSLKSARGFMHMKITNREGHFILGQFSQPFSSIPLMIQHYSISKLPIKGAEHMSLLHPVNHPELL